MKNMLKFIEITMSGPDYQEYDPGGEYIIMVRVRLIGKGGKPRFETRFFGSHESGVIPAPKEIRAKITGFRQQKN